ncbi:MAG TPA: ATP-binding cassette domain-containing protein [Firmicutes bacterium]|nr:ATP-binding cassette domain-containing protein [Bacillota bacterium]HHY97622.1 ATP-binding cassette domain-containing protein [Bacillota bacterium]
MKDLGEPLVKVQCIKHTYPDRTQVDLCGLDFTVRRGQRVVVLGANGSGKTTLLFHIVGILKPLEGNVQVFGMDPAKEFWRIRDRIGVVLQELDEQIIGPTVWDDVSFGLKSQGLSRSEVDARVGEVLGRLGISHLTKRIPHYLSGGEKRKVALAGALIRRPELLILDEPFAGVDPGSRRELISLLSELNRESGLTYIMALHEVELVPEVADYVYVIKKGGIALKGTPREVFSRGDLLRENNLDVPSLVELFDALRERNWPVTMPLTIPEAADQLERMIGG